MTAEEKYIEFWDESPKGNEGQLDLMIEFAKYHVEKALEEASELATTDCEPDYRGGTWYTVDKESILNAYPLENIK